ncbi:isoprenoid synthase domain-containing protein [Aspergillus avenaceus]|uniref:Isoprenoid synthase domain-containing protein n=1 Tax=Aspergillus avenaceus TaxID=36643 RepID=A0A5N6U4V4_ASPAV|nr:isoprenoid synthase domain-containing protein [Aspergillus avenaceus]
MSSIIGQRVPPTQLWRWSCLQSPSTIFLPFPIHRKKRLISQFARQSHPYQSNGHQDRVRAIRYGIDPLKPAPKKRISNAFPFLQFAGASLVPSHNVNKIVPSTVGVPWTTLFRASLQSKYWLEAEETAKGFIEEILGKRGDDKPQEYINAATEAAVSFGINVTPMGDLGRMIFLTKFWVFVFLSDDAADSGNRAIMIPLGDELKKSAESEHVVYNTLAKEAMSYDMDQGKRLMESLVFWGTAMQEHGPEWSPTLEDYMDYRIKDVGAGTVSRAVEFACDVSLSEADRKVVSCLQPLCDRHFILTNDRYSYAKEIVAEQECGAAVVNSVRVVRRLMNTSDSSAKAIIQQIIWDIEYQMHAEYERLSQGGVTTPQLTYAQGMIASMAGNKFYSATCPRYARATEGSELHKDIYKR